MFNSNVGPAWAEITVEGLNYLEASICLADACDRPSSFTVPRSSGRVNVRAYVTLIANCNIPVRGKEHDTSQYHTFYGIDTREQMSYDINLRRGDLPLYLE